MVQYSRRLAGSDAGPNAPARYLSSSCCHSTLRLLAWVALGSTENKNSSFQYHSPAASCLRNAHRSK